MKQVDGVVGNVDDDPDLAAAVADHEHAGTLETVVLDDTERKRSRLRVTTDAGTELGVLVDTPELTAGDVLVREDDRAVVVAFEDREAFVIVFPSETATATAVELGHRIGNQHWDIAVDGGSLYVPVDADRAIIEEVLGPYIPDSATTRYETVDAERFVDGESETDGDDSGHSHDHADSDHSHEHDHTNHDHSHAHDHDHDHSHEEPQATATEEDQ
jgi:urease accessory protein